jgi:hypothetical protein
MMKVYLQVNVDGLYGSWAGAVTLKDELYLRHFEPLKTCDSGVMAFMTGEVLPPADRIVMKARRGAAETLANEIAALIIAAMGKGDTHNGYPKADA